MERLNAISAVFFDFDGTLVSLPVNYTRMRNRLSKLFATHGVKSNFKPLLDSVEHLLAELKDKNYPVSLLREARNKAYAIIEDEELVSVNQAQLANGAKKLLSFLQGNEIKVVIISRNGMGCIQACIEALDIPKPELIISRDEVDFEELKPAPRQATMALNKLKLKPTEVVLIGDSLYDIQCGRSLGIRTVLVGRSKHTEESLNADFVISSLSDLMELL